MIFSLTPHANTGFVRLLVHVPHAVQILASMIRDMDGNAPHFLYEMTFQEAHSVVDALDAYAYEVGRAAVFDARTQIYGQLGDYARLEPVAYRREMGSWSWEQEEEEYYYDDGDDDNGYLDPDVEITGNGSEPISDTYSEEEFA